MSIKVPATLRADAESGVVSELRSFLSKRHFGQDRVTQSIIDVTEYFYSPLYDPTYPVFVGLFDGPSGSGKTYYAELLSKFFFNDPEGYLRIPCVIYQQPHEVAKIIGAPPGYIGYYDEPILGSAKIRKRRIQNLLSKYGDSDDEIGSIVREVKLLEERQEETQTKLQLEATIRDLKMVRAQAARKADEIKLPTIILFDEIEKANRSLHNFLLELVVKGKAELGNGRISKIPHAYILMTSNASARAVAKAVTGVGNIGFGIGSGNRDPVYTAAIEGIKKIFDPTFIGRLDAVEVFRSLGKSEFMQIFDWSVLELNEHLTKQGLKLQITVSENAREYIVEKAIDHPEIGARLIKSKVRKYIREPLARILNSGQLKPADMVRVELLEDKLVFLKDDRVKIRKSHKRSRLEYGIG